MLESFWLPKDKVPKRSIKRLRCERSYGLDEKGTVISTLSTPSSEGWQLNSGICLEWRNRGDRCVPHLDCLTQNGLEKGLRSAQVESGFAALNCKISRDLG
jgi:hypothetical protein